MLYALALLATCAASAGAGETIALENGQVRIEVDPRLFSLRYVGAPGGENFVEPLFVPPEELTGVGWVDPGGLYTDLHPYQGHVAEVRRGPGHVLSADPLHVAMLGPPAEEAGVRIKKEVRLHALEPRATYAVTLTNISEAPQTYALRNFTRVPYRSTLRIRRRDGKIAPLAGTEELAPAVVKSLEYWLIPVPPTTSEALPLQNVVLGAFVPRVEIRNRSGVWTRRIAQPPVKAEAPQGATFLCLLDDPTRSYACILQSASTELEPGGSMTFTEEWRFDVRGANAMSAPGDSLE